MTPPRDALILIIVHNLMPDILVQVLSLLASKTLFVPSIGTNESVTF